MKHPAGLLLFGVSLCALIGCATEGTRGQISVRVLDKDGNTAVEVLRGRICRVRIAVKNASADLLIIRGVDVEDQLPDTVRWYGAQYGSVHRPDVLSLPGEKAPADEWTFDPMAQQLSDGVFATSALLPGETCEVTREVAIFGDQLCVHVGYQSLNAQEANGSAYFPVAQAGQRIVFRRLKLADGDLGALRKKLVAGMLVLPDANRFPISSQTCKVSLLLAEGPFPLAEARQRVDFKVARAVYWTAEDGWVLQSADRRTTALVGKDRLVPLPACDLLAFVLVDGAGEQLSLVLPLAGYHMFRALPPRTEGPGYFNPGTTSLKTESLLGVLTRARGLGHALHVVAYDPNGLGRNQYLVIGDLRPALRRTFAQEKVAYRLWYDFSPVAPEGRYYLWKTGEPQPQVVTTLEELRKLLSNAEKDSAVLLLPSRAGDDCSWARKADLQGYCRDRGLRLLFGPDGAAAP